MALSKEASLANTLDRYAERSGLRNRILAMTRNADLMLALLVVSIIGLMIVPLPSFIIDSLIALNLAVSVSLLMISLYITRSVKLFTFPSILLFTTLFRIALNISTTRKILLEAEAGDIIETFGRLVIGGNYIVGAIVFLIITVVQFLVIAKGGERVAEVAARFSLDSLPGKQMSIDAEMRSGTLDPGTARKRRSILEKESQMYGAMDGAMKFVKGDAIAGLVISVINIVGGLTVGVLQHGMSVSEAAGVYTILSIGDGLVSQIPALFGSITAGIIVTKVSSDETLNLGADIGNQFFAYPKALLIGSAIVTAFAFMPGFPKMQFLVLGFALGATGFVLQRSTKGPAEQIEETAPGLAPGWIPFEAVGVTVSPGIQDCVSISDLDKAIQAHSRKLSNEMGMEYPSVRVSIGQKEMPEQYVVRIHEVDAISGSLPDSSHYFPAESGAGEAITEPRWLRGLRRMPKGERDALESETELPGAELIALHVKDCLKQHTAMFLGLQETRRLLDRMETTHQSLVKEVSHHLPLPKLAEVLRLLLADGLPIRNMPLILEVLADAAPREKNAEALADAVRASMQRYISHQVTRGRKAIRAVIMDGESETKLRQALRITPSGKFLDLPTQVQESVVAEVRDHVHSASADLPLAFLCSMDIRRMLQRLCSHLEPKPLVLAFDELTYDVQVTTVGRIKF